MLGGQEIYETLSEQLGVGHDQTTADGRITLEHAECLAACDYAPVVTVNYEFFDQQTTDSATGLVEELRAGGRPLPTRGAPLCTFKEISRQLAGFVDERPGAVDAVSAGEPTDGRHPAGGGAGRDGAGVRRADSARQAGRAPAPAASTPLRRPAPLRRPRRLPLRRAGPADAGRVDSRCGGFGCGRRRRPRRRSGLRPRPPAERSAAAGTSQYGGSPDQPSSGSGEGLPTAASDPAADQSPDKEPESAQASSADPDAPTRTEPGPTADRPTPTSRGRKIRRKEELTCR